MGYTALYRKFRPQTFEEVKGQDGIVTTLRNQIRTGRIGHAYLFCGTRGTGKTSVAKLFAKAVNCEHNIDADPCGECESCLAAASGASANIIEIDAASNNSVDDVRNIREEVTYRPTEGRYKVYIIDEAHMLSTGAFNALLKTLEEPPEYVIFILATTEAAKLPVTIVSRCQRYDFKRINTDEIQARIDELLSHEGISAEEKSVRYISRLADGSLRDALSLLERCVSGLRDETLTYDKVLEILGTVDSEGFYEMLDSIKAGDVAAAIRKLDDYAACGKDMASFVSDFTWYLRNLLIAKNAEDFEDILDVSSEEAVRIKEQGSRIEDAVLMRYIRIFSGLSGRLRNSASKRVEVEMALIRLCRPQMDTDVSALEQRISELEKAFEERRYAAPAPPDRTPEQYTKKEDIKPEVKIIKKAPPAELVKIKDKWHSIISGMPGMFRNMLNGSEPEYDAETGDNILYIKVRSNTIRDTLKQSADLNVLTDALYEAAGGTVETVFISGENSDISSKLAGIPDIKKLEEEITIPIEIID